MEELIIEQHGNEVPNTYMNGSLPIDGSFSTNAIHATYSGYTIFSWGLYSDHQLLWADLDMTEILGTNAVPLWKPKATRLQCNNPELISKFHYCRQQHYKVNGMDDKIRQINTAIQEKSPVEEWSVLVEQLEQLILEEILEADGKCRKLKMGNIPWSPELQQSMTRIGYFQRCRLKYCNNKAVNSRTLLNWYNKAKVDTKVQSANKAILRLQEEFKINNKIKKDAGKKEQISFKHSQK
jgi:hypothetical protein